MKQANCLSNSRSNPFLEPTSTKQWGWSFLLKETTGAFDSVPTQLTDYELESG